MMVELSVTPGRRALRVEGEAVVVGPVLNVGEPDPSRSSAEVEPVRHRAAAVSAVERTGEQDDVTAESAVVWLAADAPSHDRGRRERLRQLYEEHYVDLVRLATLLLDRTEVAEEVVQDAFVKLAGALDRIEDEAATPAYLRSMVMNGARSRLRRRQVARKHQPAPEPPAEPADAAAVLHEDQREVIAALRTLPARQRECLVLRYYTGCNEAEIAAALGIARGTVKSSISRGMAAMAARLEGSR